MASGFEVGSGARCGTNGATGSMGPRVRVDYASQSLLSGSGSLRDGSPIHRHGVAGDERDLSCQQIHHRSSFQRCSIPHPRRCSSNHSVALSAACTR